MSSSAQPRRGNARADRGGHRRESARTVLQRLQAIPVQLFPPHVFTTRMLGDAAVEGSDGARVFPAVTSYPDAFTAASTQGARGCPTAAGSVTELGGNAICVLASAAAASSVRAGPVNDASLASRAVAAPPVQHRFVYEVAAAHALRGGCVLYLSAPASASFSLTRFAVTVERQWVAAQRLAPVQPTACADYRATSIAGVTGSVSAQAPPQLHQSPPCDSPEARLLARQRAVLAAVRRVEVLSCGTVADVYAVCQAYTFPTRHDAESEARCSDLEGKEVAAVPTGDGEAAADVVPLCIVDDLTGPTSSCTLLERAMGKSLPHPHHLLCVLQRRLRCALLVLEERTSSVGDRKVFTSSTRWWAPSAVPPSPATAAAAATSRYCYDALAAELRQQGSDAGRTGGGDDWVGAVLPSPESALAASDFVQRLRTPHVHVSSSHRDAQDVASVEEGRRRRHSAEVGRASSRKLARVEVTSEGRDAAAVLTPAPVSLHDVQLSLLYLECVEEPCVVGHGVDDGYADAVTGVACGDDTPSGSENLLLLPHAVAWRYRAHFMRATPSEAGAGGSGQDPRRHQGNSSSSVAAGTGGCGGPAWASARTSSTGFQYSGTWMCGSQWRCL